jgi:cytochrome P450
MPFEGVRLKKGDMVVCPTILHGLDDNANAEPFKVDFGRKRGRHSTFGSGSHTCPGAHLAGVELRIMLQEWLARIPEFQVAPDCKISITGGIVGSVNRFSLCWSV